jgi:hypothetical protein
MKALNSSVLAAHILDRIYVSYAAKLKTQIFYLFTHIHSRNFLSYFEEKNVMLK